MDGEGNAITGTLPTSGTYYLTDDVSLTEVCDVSGNLNLWLNGFNVTIADTYTADADLKNEYAFHVGTGNAGLLLLKSGTIIGGTTTGWGGAVYVAGGSTMRMSGGTVTGGTAGNGGNIGSRGLVYITGGNITNGAYTSGKGGNVYAIGDVEISGASTVISGGKSSGETTKNDRANLVCWGSSLKLTDVDLKNIGVWVASDGDDICTVSGKVIFSSGAHGLQLSATASTANGGVTAKVVAGDSLSAESYIIMIAHDWGKAANAVYVSNLSEEQANGNIFVPSGFNLKAQQESGKETYELILAE